MRENRLYGSEGGEVKSLPYPYQTKPQMRSPSLDCFALLAMTDRALVS
jgi:hypothetical protein